MNSLSVKQKSNLRKMGWGLLILFIIWLLANVWEQNANNNGQFKAASAVKNVAFVAGMAMILIMTLFTFLISPLFGILALALVVPLIFYSVRRFVRPAFIVPSHGTAPLGTKARYQGNPSAMMAETPLDRPPVPNQQVVS